MIYKILYLLSEIPDKRRVQLLWLFVLTIITSIVEAISIGAVVPFLAALTSPDVLYENEYILVVVEWLSIGDPQKLLPLFSLFFAVLILISGFLRILLLWSQTRIGFAIGIDFDKKIYKNILYKPYLDHLTTNSSELVSGLTTKTSQVVMQLVIPSLTILSSTLILITILSLLLSINPRVAALSLLTFGSIYFVIYMSSKKYIRRSSKNISIYQSRVIQILQESLGGIRDILIDSLQPVFQKTYLDSDSKLRRSMGNNVIIANTPKFAIEAISMAIIVLMVNLFFDKENGIVEILPIIGLIVLSAQRLLPVLQQIFSSISLIGGVSDTTEDVINLLRKGQSLRCCENTQELSALNFNESIKFCNVYYRYKHDREWILNNANFNFNKGDKIGIIGKTGSGKSTLVDLIIGLISPTKGEILIDGEILAEEINNAWQKNISHVPQVIFLSDSTIAENIAFGVATDKIDYSLIEKAAEDAQISSDIESWSDGYNTIVGENGVRLSGGQRQRIGIARALYKKSNLIVFDEATSALDTETELSIMKTINSIDSKITIIIITHRLSTLKDCNHIIDLDKLKV
jgi:ATP-binding cassette, subfamily B, bacterial PglK